MRKSPIKKEDIRRIPGQSLQEKIDKDFLDAIIPHIIYPFAVAFGIVNGILACYVSYWFGWLIFVVYCVWGFFGLLNIPKFREKIGKARLGRNGELMVGQILDDCKPIGWKIIHDFQTDSIGNIDHIIVAAQGVFTIETKTISKFELKETIIYDGETIRSSHGRRLDTLDNPLSEAEREAKFLKNFLYKTTGRTFPIDPMPIITYPGWFITPPPWNIRSKITVMNPNLISSYIQRKPEQLSSEDQVIIYEALVRANK